VRGFHFGSAAARKTFCLRLEFSNIHWVEIVIQPGKVRLWPRLNKSEAERGIFFWKGRAPPLISFLPKHTIYSLHSS